METLQCKNQHRYSISWGNRWESVKVTHFPFAGYFVPKPFSGIIGLTVIFMIFPSFFFQRFNADYELTARQGADTMAYIALLEEKLRPALVTPPLFCLFPGKHWCESTVNVHSDVLCPVVAHFLGGCRKLRQSDTAMVCVTLPFPSQLSRPLSPCQHRPLPHPSNQRRGAAAQNHWGGGEGKYWSVWLISHVLCQLFVVAAADFSFSQL